MKISLLEPLRVSKEYIEELARPLKDLGHEFVYHETKTTDPDELYERSKDSEVVIIANNSYPKEVIEKLDTTKFIDVAFTGVDHVDNVSAKKRHKNRKCIGLCHSSSRRIIYWFSSECFT